MEHVFHGNDEIANHPNVVSDENSSPEKIIKHEHPI